ncbi:MAG: BadF/BadG/BcrA/BcrD ATPase family protein, partial [Clostridia bacterium]
MGYYIGIDGGGTHARLLAADTDFQAIGSAEGQSTNIESNACDTVQRHLAELFARFVQQSGAHLSDCLGVCIGTAGVDTPQLLQTVEALVANLALPCPVTVVNDAEIALAAQTRGDAGMLLIAGTGSIGYAINRAGTRCRVGGYGYLVSDEGSGYWLGSRAIAAVLQAQDQTGPETCLSTLVYQALGIHGMDALVDFVYQSNKSDVARLAPLLFTALDADDSVAERIVTDAADHLSRMPCALARRLAMNDAAYPLVL